jgi:hypothetical protein
MVSTYALPNFAPPKFALPKFAPPKFALPKERQNLQDDDY